MNSRQKNFFITPEDYPQIVNFFDEHGCILIRNNIKSATIDSSVSFIKENIFQVFLTNANFVEQVFFKKLDKKDYYYIDVVNSYVIEFDIGGFYPYSKNVLHRGRFYSIISFQENHTLMRKDDIFVDWIKKIYRLFENRFLVKRKEYHPYYFSESALKWIDENNANLVEGGLKFLVEDN